MRVTTIKCVKGYSFSLRGQRGFRSYLSASDDSDRESQIYFSTARTSSASVVSSPDVERVLVFISFSLLCVSVRCMHMSQEWLHIPQEVYTILSVPDVVFSCAYILAGWLARCLHCDRSFRSQTSSAHHYFLV